jgi:KDO2-lipid IV(A) lauroyltransferase
MQLLGRLYYTFNRTERELISSNIRDLLEERDEAFIRKTIKEAFRGIFTHYFEKMFSAYKNFPDIKKFIAERFTIENEYLIREALDGGKGVILVTAHWGAVEFIPWLISLKGYPLSVILECQTPLLMQALTDKTRFVDTELVAEGNCNVLFTAFDCLKRNRVLMTECDEVDKWRKRKNQTINLFGKTLYFDNTLDILAKKADCPVIGTFLKRNPDGTYTLFLEKIEREQGTARKSLELWQKYVSESPEQWYQWKKWNKMKAVI